MTELCSVEGCSTPRKGGPLLCSKHYSRWRRTGTTELLNGRQERGGKINHGTSGGYQQHRRRGEAACGECKQAVTAYVRLLRERRSTLQPRGWSNNRLTTKQEARIERTDGCWIWRGYVDEDGYGKCGGLGAYAVVYRALVGPIPGGYHVDHLCHNQDATCSGGPACPHRKCVRPDHLAAVPAQVNSANQYGRRKAACKSGHRFTEDNTYWQPGNGRRQCRACARAHTARRRQSQESAA
jgi:hypothetical protein